jgi:predicted MFS family arabinose efflux permease
MKEHATPLKSWLAVLSISIGAFVVVTSEFLPIGLLTRIATGLHVADGTAGLMVTVPGAVAALTGPIMTIGAGRIDRRILVLALIALLVISDLIAALAPNFTIMLAARVLFGVSLGGFWTIAVTLGSRLVPKAMMARASTMITAGISIATVLGVPAGTFLAGFAGWRAAFAGIGGVALLAGVTQLFVLPRIPAPPSPGLRQLTHLLRHADARLGLLTIAFVIAGHFAAYTYVAPFLKENGVGSDLLSTLLLAYGVAGIVGNFAGGAAAARNLRSTVTAVVGLMAASIFLLPFARGWRGLSAYRLGTGLRRHADRASALGLQGGARGAGRWSGVDGLDLSNLHRPRLGPGRASGGRVRHFRRDVGRGRPCHGGPVSGEALAAFAHAGRPSRRPARHGLNGPRREPSIPPFWPCYPSSLPLDVIPPTMSRLLVLLMAITSGVSVANLCYSQPLCSGSSDGESPGLKRYGRATARFLDRGENSPENGGRAIGLRGHGRPLYGA